MADPRKPSRTRRLRRIVALGLFGGLVSILCFLGLTLSRPPLPTIKGLEFYDYLHQASWDELGVDLVSLSPSPIAAIDGAAKTNGGLWFTLYENVYPHFPKSFQSRMPPPLRSTQVQIAALQALGAYGPAAKSTLPTVVRAARSQNQLIRHNALAAALQIDHQSPEVIALFRELLSDPAIREEAAGAIYAEMRLPPQAESALLPLDWSTNPGLPLNSISALSLIGLQASSEVTNIVRALQIPLRSDREKINLLVALRGMGPAATPALTPIIELAQNSSNAFLRLAAIQTLMQIGKPAKQALDILPGLLNDPDPKVRIAAAGAIGTIDSPTEASLTTLFNELNSSNDSPGLWRSPFASRFGLTPWAFNSSQAAAEVLAELAPHKRIEQALPTLQKYLDDQQASALHGLVAQVIYRQTREANRVVPPLITSLSFCQYPHERVLCCVALAEMGQEASPALGALQAAQQIDLHTGRAALYAIASIKGESVPPSASD